MVFLDYQSRWNADKSRVKVAEKSRRVGISWADAAEAALDAARTNGSDTWYIGYNREMSEQYIEDCGKWAQHFELWASEKEEIVLKDDADQSILAFRVRFASGHKVTALSSRPSNLRAKKGRIVIDEAAFHDDLAALLKAAMAILMWGGSVSIISTHNGVLNDFNHLVEAVREKELAYSLHKITLDDALGDGLYRRICLMQGKPWSVEGEFQWRAQLYRDYGVDAAEELGCIPFEARPGGVLDKSWFEIVDAAPMGGIECRFWDMAATAKDVNVNACYTSGVKLRKLYDTYYVMDVVAQQLGPTEGDRLIVDTAPQDGAHCMVRWELEGGSAGKKLEARLKAELMGFNAAGLPPMGDKLTRAKPFATEAKNGNVKLVRASWNDQYLSWLHAFDGTNGKGKVNDPIDASSGAYQVLYDTGGPVRARTIGRKRLVSRLSGY